MVEEISEVMVQICWLNNFPFLPLSLIPPFPVSYLIHWLTDSVMTGLLVTMLNFKTPKFQMLTYHIGKIPIFVFFHLYPYLQGGSSWVQVMSVWHMNFCSIRWGRKEQRHPIDGWTSKAFLINHDYGSKWELQQSLKGLCTTPPPTSLVTLPYC